MKREESKVKKKCQFKIFVNAKITVFAVKSVLLQV